MPEPGRRFRIRPDRLVGAVDGVSAAWAIDLSELERLLDRRIEGLLEKAELEPSPDRRPWAALHPRRPPHPRAHRQAAAAVRERGKDGQRNQGLRPPGRGGQPRRNRTTGGHLQPDAGGTRGGARTRAVGTVRACPGHASDDHGRDDRLDRARDQPAAGGDRHQRQRRHALAGAMPSPTSPRRAQR